MLLAAVDDPRVLPVVVSRLRAMNLRVESRKDIAERTKRAMAVMEGTFSVVSAVLLVLTMIAMVNAYLAIVYNRSYEFSLQRVLGASRARLVLSFAGEAAVVGAFYGVIGYGLGYAATGYLSGNLYRWAPLLKGLRLAPAGGDVLVLSAALSALVSLLSALVPSLFASNLNLFRAIRKQG
jgi:putative ABC transport system permease protein